MRIAPSQSLKQDATQAVAHGNHKKALRCFSALEKLEPENGDWSLQVGLMYHHLGKRRHAVDALERAARRCHVQQRNERAEAIYEQILRLEPQHDVARQGLQSLRKHGRSRTDVEQPVRERYARTRNDTKQQQNASRPILRRPPTAPERLPAASSTFPTVTDSMAQRADTDTDGFGIPTAKSGRVAMALAALKF